jgi:copper(I)-binding protein
MFLDLKQPLQRDSKVPVTLEFEKAGKLTLEFTVQQRPSDGAVMHHDMH